MHLRWEHLLCPPSPPRTPPGGPRQPIRVSRGMGSPRTLPTAHIVGGGARKQTRRPYFPKGNLPELKVQSIGTGPERREERRRPRDQLFQLRMRRPLPEPHGSRPGCQGLPGLRGAHVGCGAAGTRRLLEKEQGRAWGGSPEGGSTCLRDAQKRS